MSALVLVLLGLMACSDPPTHQGTVTDRWGKPLAGVTVVYSGTALQVVSGADGRFSIPVATTDITVRAGKLGFIKQTVALSAPGPNTGPAPVRFALYPDPAANGFYAVGSAGYTHIGSKLVKTVGTDIRAFHGLVDVGKVRVKGEKPAEFVFSSQARRSELRQLGLQLHKLDFLEHDSLPGVLGETEVKLNLWTSGETVPFDLAALETDNDYTIRTRKELKPGVYAFHTQGILTSIDPLALDKLPAEMRVAFPFEVR